MVPLSGRTRGWPAKIDLPLPDVHILLESFGDDFWGNTLESRLLEIKETEKVYAF